MFEGYFSSVWRLSTQLPLGVIMINVNSQSSLLMQPAESRQGGGAYRHYAAMLSYQQHEMQNFTSDQEDIVMEKMLDDW